jgi:hypothetical protein
MDLITFDGFPKFDTTRERALYVPTGFNYRIIDGIILWLDLSNRESEKKKALLFPLQVTIAKSHSDSEEKFFNRWRGWVQNLKDFDVEVEFLWVTDQESSHADVEAKYRSTRARKKVLIHPKYRTRNIAIESVNPDIWRRYQDAKHDLESRSQKLVVGNHVPE